MTTLCDEKKMEVITDESAGQEDPKLLENVAPGDSEIKTEKEVPISDPTKSDNSYSEMKTETILNNVSESCAKNDEMSPEQDKTVEDQNNLDSVKMDADCSNQIVPKETKSMDIQAETDATTHTIAAGPASQSTGKSQMNEVAAHQHLASVAGNGASNEKTQDMEITADEKSSTASVDTSSTQNKSLGKEKKKLGYRDVGSGDEASSEASSSSESSDDSSDEEDKVVVPVCKEDDDEDQRGKKGAEEVKTKGELYPEDLPPLEDLKVTIDESVIMEEVGQISGIVGVLVIVQANKGIPALDVDSILFLEGRKILGQVFETFGPVPAPLYSVRFNSVESIEKNGIKPGMSVYWASNNLEYSHFVFMEQLMRMKGSDASWEHNNEPPDKFLDYSDDESERRAKAKARGRNIKEGDNDAEGNDEQKSFRKRKPRKERPVIQQASTAPPHGAGQMEPKIDTWPPRFPGPRQRWMPPPQQRQHFGTMTPTHSMPWQQAPQATSPWQQQQQPSNNPWVGQSPGMITIDTSQPPPNFSNAMQQRPFHPGAMPGFNPQHHGFIPQPQEVRPGLVQIPSQFGDRMPVFGGNPQLMPMYGAPSMPSQGHTFGTLPPGTIPNQQPTFGGGGINPYGQGSVRPPIR